MRSVKLWSDYFIYLGVLFILASIVNCFLVEKEILVIFGICILMIIGYFCFKRVKLLEYENEPILLESVFGVNYDSIQKSGVNWEDILKAKELLNKYKETFIWSSENLFDILVVYYCNDSRTELGIKVLKNTRKLKFEGLVNISKEKFKLDSLDLSNFNTSILSELKSYDTKTCKIDVVRPIDTKYLQTYFNVKEKDLKSHIYNIEEIIGGAF